MKKKQTGRAALDKGWVIANHILVSFHMAFISSVLSIGADVSSKSEVLQFMFASPETIVSIMFMYISFHIAIAIHEMGHYLAAVRLNALSESSLGIAQKKSQQQLLLRLLWYVEMFVKIPFGKFKGVRKTGLDYHPDAPYNLAVSAAGPMASRYLAIVFMPLSFLLISGGIFSEFAILIYVGRLFLGIGMVGLLDFLLADPGKYKEFKQREKKASGASKKVKANIKGKKVNNIEIVKKVKKQMIYTRMQTVNLPDGDSEFVPWEFSNCGMGGRHTEKEFPESNISLQESMFVPLSAKNYEDAQEMTVSLQTRLKEIIENADGCIVKGIGTEGGIAAYIKKEENDILPVQRLWRMQKQAILECGYVPGGDVAMAIDPAASELENAYRIEKGLSGDETIGTYLAWRDDDKLIMSRDMLFDVYYDAIEKHNLPIISIEDGFSEEDDEGWKMLMARLGDRIHVIGDDNITTKDSSIEEKADKQLINTALIKLNQIGSVTEGSLALLTAIGKGLETVISHRSKSPIEDFEAQVALAANSLGLKAGGGANSERLFKYESVNKVMKDAIQKLEQNKENGTFDNSQAGKIADEFIGYLCITEIIAREEATNAGIPTVAVEINVGIPGSKQFSKLLTFGGATPLGTSAGTDEAIHLIDKIVPNSRLVSRYSELFELNHSDQTYRFRKQINDEFIAKKIDPEITKLWKRAKRYNGKGCLNAVDNINYRLKDVFWGRKAIDLPEIGELDNELLRQELKMASERNIDAYNASPIEKIKIMQRKANMGMNALLSMSLALSRLKGAIEGKGLYEVIREQMSKTIAKVFYANGGLEHLDELQQIIIDREIQSIKYKKIEGIHSLLNIQKALSKVELTKLEQSEIVEKTEVIIRKIKNNTETWKTLSEELSINHLCLALRLIELHRDKNTSLHELIREQLPVYKFD